MMKLNTVVPMKIRSVIVDDEAPARDELCFLLSSYPDIEICAQAHSADKGIAVIEKEKPDLVFLDIQMPGKNGFEVIQALSAMESPPVFVFVTAYDNYAIKAFEASAVDYILKPLSEKRLATTIERVRKLLSENTEAPLESQLASLLNQVAPKVGSEVLKISVEKNGRMRLLSPKDLIYCSYKDSHILVHTFDEALPIYGIATMDKLEQHLSGASFFRAHRSLLVNLDFIKEFSPWFNGKYNLVMADKQGSELAVSRSRVKEFKRRLGI